MKEWKLENIFNNVNLKILRIQVCGLRLKVFLDGDLLP